MDKKENRPLFHIVRLGVSCFILLFMPVSCLQGQGKIAFNLQEIDPQKGIFSYNIRTLIEDKKKNIWIATQDGLTRYNGSELVTYSQANEGNTHIAGNDITALAADSATNLVWITAAYKGINAIDCITGTVRYTINLRDFPIMNTKLVKSLFVRNGTLLFGTDSGLYSMTINLSHPPQILPVADQSAISIDKIIPDNFNRLWLLLGDGNARILDPHSLKTLESIPASDIFRTPVDTTTFRFWDGVNTRQNSIIAATAKGLAILCYDSKGYRKKTVTIFDYLTEKFSIPVFSCNVDAHGSFWFSTKTALYRADDGHYCEIIPSQRRFKLSTVYTIWFDTHDNLWAGTPDGLFYGKNYPAVFTAYRATDNPLGAIKHAYYLYPFSPKELYCCGADGLYHVNLENNQIRRLDSGKAYDYVFHDPFNRLIVSNESGLFILDGTCFRPVGETYPEFNCGAIKLNSHSRLNDSIVVLGSQNNRGIFIWNIYKHRLINITANTSPLRLKENVVNFIFSDARKRVCVLSNYSVTVLNLERNTIVPTPFQNPALRYSLFMDMCQQGNSYWIASYGTGIIETDTSYNIKSIYSEKQGMSNNGVYKIIPFSDTLLFITTNLGLSVFNLKTKTFKNFFEEDGLQSNTFDETGGNRFGASLYAGGVNGFTVINPQYLTRNMSPPIVYFTHIKTQTTNGVMDTSNLEMQEITLPRNWLQTNVVFTGINYGDQEKVTYKYRIVEKDSAWLALGRQNFVSLMGLSPGTYRLQVKASNEDGVWSVPREITLQFLPKWYQAWWFKTSSIATLILLLYGFYRFRIGQLKKQQQIRREIASDLHDDIGGTLNSVKIFTHLLEASKNRQEYIDQIKESLKQASVGLRDMIWVLDDKEDTVEELIARLKQFAMPVANASDVQIKFSSESTNNLELNKTEKRNLLLIAKEAINNSIKYAQGKRIEVTFTKSGGKTTMIVQDDGIGFNEDEITRGNGLKNIRERAKQINYIVLIQSEKGKGTKISVSKR